jgi:hypothetical protein
MHHGRRFDRIDGWWQALTGYRKLSNAKMPEFTWPSTLSGKAAVPKTPAGDSCLDKAFELIEGHLPALAGMHRKRGQL